MLIQKINNFSYYNKTAFCAEKSQTVSAPAQDIFVEEKVLTGKIGSKLTDEQIEKLNKGWKLPESYRFVHQYHKGSSLGPDYKIMRNPIFGKPTGSKTLPENYVITKSLLKDTGLGKKPQVRLLLN